jgi:multiple sugar transport system permease protein
LLPKEWLLNHYIDLFTTRPYARWYGNTILLAATQTALVLFFCSLAGYGFGKYNFRFKGVLFGILIGTLMVPSLTTLIPTFVLMSKLGLVNTYQGIILPGMAPAFGIFLMTQFMHSIPDELLDAGRIDGSSEFGLYRRIVLPLMKPALGALAIFTFLGSWNNYLWPLIILRDMDLYNLPVGIATLRGLAGSTAKVEWGMILAASTLSILPILVLFVAMQRQFIAGLTLGSVKG